MLDWNAAALLWPCRRVLVHRNRRWVALGCTLSSCGVQHGTSFWRWPARCRIPMMLAASRSRVAVAGAGVGFCSGSAMTAAQRSRPQPLHLGGALGSHDLALVALARARCSMPVHLDVWLPVLAAVHSLVCHVQNMCSAILPCRLGGSGTGTLVQVALEAFAVAVPARGGIVARVC